MARAIRPPKVSMRLPALRMPRLPDPNEPDVFEEMTLQEHLTELRDRIMRICISVGVAFVVGFILAKPLLNFIRAEAGAAEGLDILSPTDPLTLTFKVALYIAIGISLPIIIYQLVAFLAPGLTRKEKRILYLALPFVSILLILGGMYGFFVAAPRALSFLSGWFSDVFLWSPNANETVTFYLTLMIGLGLAFQLPVVMFILSKLSIVSADRMRKWRKYAFMGILVLAAIITPTTDPINLMIVAAPIYVLYEFGIVIARVFGKPIRVGEAAA